MKRISLFAALLVAVVLAVAGIATAGGNPGVGKTWIYDPGNIGGAVASWTDGVLTLQKNVDTTALVAAGASIKGVQGQQLSQPSFDVKGDCGAGAPRFNVSTDKTNLFFGCAWGTHSDAGDGWTHVEFNGTEPGAGAFGKIGGVDLVQDENGKTQLRNISVNNVVVDKFPSS